MKFLVWDTLNCAPEDAECIVEAADFADAAIEYAQKDDDGWIDGVYRADGREISDLARYGQPIAVKCIETGERRDFDVGVVAFHPEWGAQPKETL